MLFYSHVWDLLLKLSSLVAMMVLLVALHGEQRLANLGVPAGATVIVIVGLGGVVWAFIYRQGLSTIAAWLYASVNLGTHVSLREARQLARLFQLDFSMKWVPLKEVKRLPSSERRRALLLALDTLGPNRKAMLL